MQGEDSWDNVVFDLMNNYGITDTQGKKLLEYTDGYQLVFRQTLHRNDTSGTICVKKVGADNPNGKGSDGYLCFSWMNNVLQ